MRSARPRRSNSFVFLAEQGYFDGQYFHRLDTSIDVIQGGRPVRHGRRRSRIRDPRRAHGEVDLHARARWRWPTRVPTPAAASSSSSPVPRAPTSTGTRTTRSSGRSIEGLDVAKKIQALPILDPSAADLSGSTTQTSGLHRQGHDREERLSATTRTRCRPGCRPRRTPGPSRIGSRRRSISRM